MRGNHYEEENMIALLSPFAVESLVFGLFWHNWSPRCEREREGEKRDPAVLFSRRSVDK
jgi:hypothetical protein